MTLWCGRPAVALTRELTCGYARGLLSAVSWAARGSLCCWDRLSENWIVPTDFCSLGWAMVSDQLDVCALGICDLLSRSVGLFEDASTENPKAPRFVGLDYLGLIQQYFRRGGGPASGSAHKLSAAAQLYGDTAIDFFNIAVVVLPMVLRRVPNGKIDFLVGEYQKAAAAFSPAAAFAGLAGYRAAGASAPYAAGLSAGSNAVQAVDSHVATVRYDESGKRYRGYDKAMNTLEEPSFTGWPMTGLCAMRWLAMFIKDICGTPRNRTSNFLADAKVPEGDRVRHEHSLLMEMLECAMVYDQLDVSALVSCELLSCSVALSEEAYTVDSKAPRVEGSDYFSGLGRRGAAIAPSRTQHVAPSLQADALIQKERREAREEQA
jgi:hypothetical protein